jgi:hypothetical protein
MKTSFTPAGVRANPAMNFLGAPRAAFTPNEDGTPTQAELDATAAAAPEAAAAAEEAAAAALAEAEAAAAADDTNKDKADLVAEKAALLKEVMKKKEALKEKDIALQAAQAELATFKGIDPAKYAALVKAMMAEAHQSQLAAKNAELEDLRQASASAAKTIDGLTIGSDFASSSFIKDSLILSPAKARILYGAHFETKDGKTVGYNKPAGEANRTLLVNSSGDPLPFDEAMKKVVEADPEKNSILKAKVQPGAGGKTTPEAGKKEATTKEGDDGLYGRTRLAAHFFPKT